MNQDQFLLDIYCLIFGICVGSFLNVLALRSLAEKSLFSPGSQCPKCHHPLSALDLIPVLSYYLLGGKCRYCKEKISWHYPLVELFTGLIFVVIVNTFGLTIYGAAMAFFACTLIAVCVTDFREKLIPHDITYPSMLLGILFSATVRHDALGTMAGIGASYILFDFLAFYGLKIYFLFNKEEPKLAKKNVDLEEKSAPAERDEVIDQNFALATPQDEEDDFEVMGGGDAVLSAVISAWLGWQRLILALLMGFLIGTLMGAFYLIIEMKKEKMLKRCIKPMVISMLGCIALTQSFLIILSTLTTQPFTSMPWAPVAIGAAVIGAILGIIIAGSHVSKPFPFGPALAAGAAVAMFYNPVGSLGSGGA